MSNGTDDFTSTFLRCWCTHFLSFSFYLLASYFFFEIRNACVRLCLVRFYSDKLRVRLFSLVPCKTTTLSAASTGSTRIPLRRPFRRFPSSWFFILFFETSFYFARLACHSIPRDNKTMLRSLLFAYPSCVARK